MLKETERCVERSQPSAFTLHTGTLDCCREPAHNRLDASYNTQWVMWNRHHSGVIGDKYIVDAVTPYHTTDSMLANII